MGLALTESPCVNFCVEIADRFSSFLHKERRPVHGYLLATVLSGLALALRIVIAPVEEGLQYVTFFPAVALAAVVGGYRAGVVATSFGLGFGTFIFTRPYYSFSIEAMQNAFWADCVFASDGLIVSVAIESLHRYRRKFVTALRQSKAAHSDLKSSTTNIKQILDNLFTYIALLDVDGEIQEVNKVPLEKGGYRRDDVIGRVFHDAPWWSYDVAVRSQLIEAMAAARQGQTRRYDAVIKMGGDLVPIDFQISPVYDGAGAIVGLLAMGVDISERKRAESEQRWLAEAVRQSTAAIVVLDASLHIQYANPAYEWLFGYSLAELWGKHISLLLPDDPALRKANPVEVGFFEGEKLRRAKDGRIIPVLVKAAPISDGDGNPMGFVLAKADLTDIKQAQSQAEAATRAKSEFLANMSHEIRTPMNGIIGLAHLAKAGEMDARTRELVETMGVSAQRLLGILNDILDVSKIESGQISIENIPFRLIRLIDDTMAMVRPAAEGKGISFSVRISPEVPRCLRGDPLRIGQALLNLVGNAVKFTEGGSVVVGIEASETGEDNVVLCFSVSDTGIGLTTEQQEQVFLPFQQADGSITRKFGGSGLGLTIVKQLAERMGGQVGVESRPGEGSTFWFTVSLGICDDLATVGECKTQSVVPVDSTLLRGTRVLLVEDDQVNRMVAVGLLEAAQVSVDVAVNGAEAVEMVERDTDYEVILMDMQMPIMDGLTATRTIRNNPKFADLPIIAMTAGVMTHERQTCLEGGMTDFIGKPFSPEQLYSTVHKWATGLGDAPMFDARMRDQIGSENLRLPTNVEGLDVRAGLRRVAGMKGLYIKTLRRFLDDPDSVVERLRQLIDDDDIKTANRIAHTLKGAAGMIEARDIYWMALAVEQALDGGDIDVALTMVTRLEARLAPLLAALHTALDNVNLNIGQTVQ